jgi:signal peptidase II
MTVPARSLRGSLVIAAAVVLVDQLTKHWAVNTLDDRDIDLLWTLRFNLHFNSGMAFGSGEGLGPIVGVIALVVVVGLLVSLGRQGDRLSTIATGLVIGGAIGNIVDRLFRAPGWFRGAVVDFIDAQWWPIFNVADMAITIGGVLLVVGSIRASRPEPA